MISRTLRLSWSKVYQNMTCDIKSVYSPYAEGLCPQSEGYTQYEDVESLPIHNEAAKEEMWVWKCVGGKRL